MKYTKFVLFLSFFLCCSQFCYGSSLNSQGASGNKIEIANPSSVSVRANEINGLSPLKKNPYGISFAVMNTKGNAFDNTEKIKKENDYIKSKFDSVGE